MSTPSGAVKVVSVSSSQGTCTDTGDPSCRLGSIPPGATVTIVIKAVVDGRGTGTVSTTATVGCYSSGNCPKDSDPANNVFAVSVHTRPYLRLAERVSRHRVRAGRRMEISFRVRKPQLGEPA